MATTTRRTRWLFAGQLGPAFDDGGPLLVVEAEEWFTERPFHRAKAHLWLSALRHAVRALEPTTLTVTMLLPHA